MGSNAFWQFLGYNTEMRTIVTALLLCSVLSAQLRASQGSDPSAAFLGMALKAYEGATGLFQGMLLRQLYGDNADTLRPS